MSEAAAWHMILSSLRLGLWLSAPILCSITLAGLLTSVAQSLTQIQEQAVGFLVKVATTIVCLWLLGPWILHRLSENLEHVLSGLAR